MLRNVLIISDAGLVLFSKEFVSAVAQPRLVGSLLTAMLEFSSNNVGAPVCYIEMSNVAVSICASHPPDESGIFALSGASVSSAGHSQLSFNPVAGSSPDKPPPFAKNRSESHHSSTSTTPQATPKQTPRRSAGGVTLICAIFHDIEDGPELGRIIAAALLAAFREQFGVSLAKVGGGTPHINLNEFDPFHARIPTVVRGLVAPIVGRLVKHASVEAALLLTDDSETAFCTADNVDSLGLGASVAALTSAAEDAMALRQDICSSVVIEGGAGGRLVVRRLSARPAALVVRCSTAVVPRLSSHAVEQSAALFERYFRLLDNFRM